MHSRNYFIDTSALFKRYIEETGTDVMDELFASDANRFISAVTPLEVISNLRRLVDVDNLITDEEFHLIKGIFLQDIAVNRLEIVELTPSLLINSLELCTEQYVTPLDALQLTSALSMWEKPVFACSDKKLLQLASSKGLHTLDPTVL